MSKRNRDGPEGIHSLLDTDLYKLTMQAALLQHFPNVGYIALTFVSNASEASYIFINRTKSMKLTHEAFFWLRDRIIGISLSMNYCVLIRST